VPSLIITTPDGQSRRHEIQGLSVHIGRSGRNSLVIEDPTVSRIHAEIVRHPEGFCLVDLGGRSGTFVNGARVIVPILLRRGDQVRIGRTSILFDAESATRVEITRTPLSPDAATRVLKPEQVRLPGAPTPTPAMAVATNGAAGSPAAVRSAPPLAPGAMLPDRTAAALLQVVLEADREMMFHRPQGEIFDAILDLAGRAVRCERAALMLLEGDALVQASVRVPRDEAGTPIAISRTIVDRVLQAQEALLVCDAQMEEPFKGHDSIIGAHVRSAMCAPLRDAAKVIGLLYVDSRRAAGLFTEEDLRILAHLASIAAAKIENARLFGDALRARGLDDELRHAAAIQEGLLPADYPAIPGYEVNGRSLSCRGVGGDSFDFLELPDGRHVLHLGDVAGKGLPAALLMCCFHSTLRALAASGLDEAGVMSRLNSLLQPRFPPNRFVTCFYATLDPAAHRLVYVNAGQDPPYLIPRRGEPRPLPHAGLPLGLFEDSDYRADSVELAPGDLLLCYSDGATEGLNPAGEMFGAGRLVATAALARDGSAPQIVAALVGAIERHHAGAAHEDDITLVVLKRAA
jgi:serine phosphatase RsbU (regulator of sigma subunit)